MKREDVLRIARSIDGVRVFDMGGSIFGKPEYLEQFAALVRAEALEEAARICDRGAKVSPDRRVGVGCARCAAAIRAAKEGS